MGTVTPIEVVATEVISTLPPLICNNLRQKIEPEKVPLKFLKTKTRKSKNKDSHSKESEKPSPLYPLQIDYSPNHFCFDVNEDTMIYKLRVWNPCSRMVYISCCGFWDESARLCASWCCYPRTRFLLAPGLDAYILIRVTPSEYCIIPFAHVTLQLAVGYLRDNVVAYFMIPIFVKFLKYVPPCILEE